MPFAAQLMHGPAQARKKWEEVLGNGQTGYPVIHWPHSICWQLVGTAMLKVLTSIRPEVRSYDPQLLMLMQTAFDEAWAVACGTDLLRDEDRELLAKVILNIVDEGDRSIASIRSRAVFRTFADLR